MTPDPDLSDNSITLRTPLETTPLTTRTRPPTPTPTPTPTPQPSPVADLKIVKTTVPTVVKPGARIRYTITVTNNGPHTATDPFVLDTIPSETTFVSCKATGTSRCGFAAGALLEVRLPDMAAGAIHTITVEVDLKDSAGPGTAIINEADVGSSTPDPNVLNDKSRMIVWVSAPVPLVVLSEFRTRGPNGARDEFIELYNRSNQRLDLSGWRIMASNGTGATNTLVTINSGTLLPARSHFLLTNSGGYSGSIPGDQTFIGDLANDGGIALMPLDGIPGDQAGMSNGSAFREGAVLLPLIGNVNQSYERKPGGARGSTQDLNNNRNDFRLLAPSDPQNLTRKRTSLRFTFRPTP